MAKASGQNLIDVHAEALKEFNASEQAQRPERLQCIEDRRFYSIAGAQWEGAAGEQFKNKMKLEMNKVHLAVIRIFNEYRNNRITVDFTPKDGVEDKLADTCNGLYRADEKDSGAEEAYDNAYEEGVGGGFGAWRLCSAYEDEEDDEDERQRIRIEPIFDADSSVYFNVGAQRQDKADATRCWVLKGLSRSDYKEKYNDDPASWPKSTNNRNCFDWARPDIVYVAEYYKVEERGEKLRIFKGLDGQEQKHYQSEFDDDEELENTLEATGFREARQKTIKKKRVHKYIMNGAVILEDCGYIAGQHIPIVPFYGKRWFVGDIERCMGHVRLAKDAQRLKNMMVSKLGEIAAYSSVRKPIFTREQMTGNELMWANDNVTNYPYLLINQMLDQNGQPVAVGPTAYSEVPDVPAPLAALLQITEQDMQDLLGNQQAGEQIEPNLSGKAVELIQNRLDMQVFIYMSNMAKAVKRSGEIWLSMAKEILVEEGRTMKTVSSNGEETGSVTLLKPMIDESGRRVLENDLSGAKFDVDVTVGPSSASKRSATVRALTSVLPFAANDPETSSVLIGMTMMNMEGEGVSDVRNYFRRKLIRIGAVEPNEEEAQELAQEQANQQPDPQAQYLQASAAQASASAEKARADTVLAVAKAGQTKAQTAEILSNIDLSHQDQLLKTAQALGEAFQRSETPTQQTEAQA